MEAHHKESIYYNKYIKYKGKYLSLKNNKQIGGNNNKVELRVFTFWTGNNPLTENRKKCLENMKNTIGVSIILITKDNLSNWVIKDYPLHPAYEYLSSVHKSDYLRCYFMHHYGGGYSDIKNQTGSWIDSFNKLNNSSNHIAIGYGEVNGGVAYIKDKKLYEEMSKNYQKLIGNGSYIFKQNTFFTKEWYNQLHRILDQKLEELKKYPATHHRDAKDRTVDGKYSNYPIEWSEILGQIFHPLVYKYSDKILKTLPILSFENYQ